MPKTALDLTPQERRVYHPVEALERRRSKEKLKLNKRRQQAWQSARQAAQLLKTEFNAKRVVVFGSLVHEAWFNDWSDIDLAAWDIPPNRFYRAVAAVTGLSTDFKIDLVDPETCRPSLRATIEQYGVEV
jgi:predicted nucleotidyltransferase